MAICKDGCLASAFLMQHIPELLNRFSISFHQDDSCIEYFLFSKQQQKHISKNLIVSHESFSHSLYVSKFYPELYKELKCKYLSAALFYLMAHHAIGLFHLKENCCVNLESQIDVFNNFYSKLQDFNFQIHHNRPSDNVFVKWH